MVRTFVDWMHLLRVEHALMTFFAVIIAELIVTSGGSLPSTVNILGFRPDFVFFAFFTALGPALITAGSFILNDLQGFESDQENKRWERPLVRGVIGKKKALKASVALFVSGLSIAFLVNLYCFLLALAFSVFAVYYDPVLKKRPLIGNAFIASSMAIPFLYGNLAVLPSAYSSMFPPQISFYGPIIVFSLIAFVVGLGRELIITLRDVEGDRMVGAKTLPMLLGKRKTAWAASIFLISAILLSFLPLLPSGAFNVGDSFNIYYFSLISVTDALLITVILKILHSQSVSTLKACRNISLAALIVGLFAFSTFAFS